MSTTALLPRNSQAYRARGAALDLWKCRDEEILIEGPAGTGKTRGMLEKAHFQMMKYPGARGLLCRKTRESLTQTVLVTFEKKVVPGDSQVLLGPQRQLRQEYIYPNGSVLVVGGLDKTSKIMSSEYDVIYVFEGTEIAQGEYEDLTTRLRNGVMPYQQIAVDCNPGPPRHWLNQRASTALMTRLRSRHEDNPELFGGKAWTPFGAKYIAKLDRLTGARKQRLRYGKWAAAEGLVYEGYDYEKHTCKKFKVPAEWRRIRSVDFGFSNPFVCQWWAIDNDDRMWMYREIYFSHRLVAHHAKQILELTGDERIEATVCDHDLEDRATLEEAGIPTVPAYKDITTGIEAVAQRLEKAGDGKPRLRVLRDATVEHDEELKGAGLPYTTEQEYDGYAYPKVQQDKAPKEVPVDKDNHGMDATRYAVGYVDNLASFIVTLSAEAPEAFTKDERNGNVPQPIRSVR